VRFAPAGAIAATIVGVALLGPFAGGSTLLDFFTRSLPHLAPATWMSLSAGAALAALGTLEVTRFFARARPTGADRPAQKSWLELYFCIDSRALR